MKRTTVNKKIRVEKKTGKMKENEARENGKRAQPGELKSRTTKAQKRDGAANRNIPSKTTATVIRKC